ncbi:hypothetical protein C8A00DRAFT_13994, partial [Chaetomidium leptoderma]
PYDTNLMIIPGTSTSDPAMVTCCAPNRVEKVDDCWLWCELPQSYFNNTGSSASHQWRAASGLGLPAR